MVQQRARRRLAAIVAADVVGYTRLMEMDEAATLTALKNRRQEILTPLVADHQGRIIKVMGDGVLIEFASAVDAVACAAVLQQRMSEANESLAGRSPILLRIGVNLGDLIVEGTDLYGDAINVAVRLQGLADPGAILISGSVHDQVRRKIDLAFDDLGPKQVKNIAEPIPVFRVRLPMTSEPANEPRQLAVAVLEPSARPAVAVLPFVNTSGEEDQEPFADGLTEDLITELSCNDGLFVIARNSVFAYKGKPQDVRQIAKDLGVRYLVEGSIRRAGGRIRVNVQLIDASNGMHLWAEKFDRTLEDIFVVQDEVCSRIAEALVGRLVPRPPRQRPRNLAAYDLVMRARSVSFGASAREEERSLLEEAILLDPDYAEAHRMLASNMSLTWPYRDQAGERQRMLWHAERAVALDPNDAVNQWTLGVLLAHERRFEESDAAFAKADKLNPNDPDSWTMRAHLLCMAGRLDEAHALVQRAFRSNPRPPGIYFWILGQILYQKRDYRGAIAALRRPETYRGLSRRALAASLAQNGEVEEAKREARFFMADHPSFRIGRWADSQPLRDETVKQHFIDGFRNAGIPD